LLGNSIARSPTVARAAFIAPNKYAVQSGAFVNTGKLKVPLTHGFGHV
jgi:hypothetical protein